MFKLNFEEKLPEILADTAKDYAVDKVEDTIKGVFDYEPNPDGEEFQESPYIDQELTYTQGVLLNNEAAQNLIDLVKTKTATTIISKKSKGESLFTGKTFLVVIAFAISAIAVDLDQALIDNTISSKEWLQMGIALVSAFATTLARGSEGSTGVYTPHYMPGLNREDFIDENSDGIDDRLQ